MRVWGVLGVLGLLGGAVFAGSAVPAAAGPEAAGCRGTAIDAQASQPADRLYGSWFVTQGYGGPLGPGERLYFAPGAGAQHIDVTTRQRPAQPTGRVRATLLVAEPQQNIYNVSYVSGGHAVWKFLDVDTYGSSAILAECAPGVDRILLLTATATPTPLQRDFATNWWANHELTPKALPQQDDPF